MLFIISPAKNLDYRAPDFEIARSKVRMIEDVAALAKVTAKLGRPQIAKLMDLSDKLADLNWQRFQAFDPALDGEDTLQAALAFNGDVYQGLSARTLTTDDLNWAQDNLRILSGLYGVLRPLDAIAPYRLEMGTRLKTRRGNSLYEFWGDRLSKALNSDLEGHSEKVVINLASTEYFSAVKAKALKAKIINCHFKEVKDGKARVLSFYAKKARGLMARYAITKRMTDPEQLKSFDVEGYRFEEGSSTANDWTFSRPQPDLQK
jgi:uncharacterized protein